MKRMQNQAKSASKRTWREKGTYVKKNWQLYLFFLMPGLLLTIIFKYLPMGGLLIAYYQSIPTELREASAIDGANEIQHFFKIMIQVCKPIIAVLALWSFVECGTVISMQ